jgi:hypothetical protein
VAFDSGVESDLPDNLKEEATLAFNAGVSEKMSISDIINKVQNNVLKKIDDIYKVRLIST